ncbi:MAG: hypothetical protein J2P58_09185 [Acidimicrobiaceae bacterium]|nr:hypothetical protein [Acidimicrobiaceae bacterium]MBO0746974.1 hypothetical protein [Acidimicrobiaceae bacterium]
MSSAPWDLDFFTPEFWYFLSGRPEKDRSQVRVDVDAQLGRRPEWQGYRDAMINPMLGFAEHVGRLPGQLCAAFRWEMTDYGLVTATVIVRCYERSAGPVDAELRTIAEWASERDPIDEHPPDVSAVNLRLGPAVRREVVIQPPAVGGKQTPLRLAVDHWVPLEFAPTVTLAIKAGTANLAMAATLIPEFDAIADRCVVRQG